jgi:hypothetical protein
LLREALGVSRPEAMEWPDSTRSAVDGRLVVVPQGGHVLGRSRDP